MANKELIRTRFRRGTQWELNTVLDIADRHDCKLVNIFNTVYGNANLVLDCTVESYMAFAKDIDMIYPGVCEFDVASIYTIMTRKG